VSEAAKVPSVSSAAINAIQDQNAREVLRQIVIGMNVRNGVSGGGDNAFMTESDMLAAFKKLPVASAIANALTSSAAQNPGKYSPIGSLITAMQAGVLSDQSFVDLATRVALIDTPTTGLIDKLASVQTGINDEHTRRINSNDALVAAINTIWAKVGDATALVQSGSQTVTNRTGAIATSWNQVQAVLTDAQTGQIFTSIVGKAEFNVVNSTVTGLSGKYTVKLDAGGYVVGYGLASEVDLNGKKSSKFYIRADNFAIGSPGDVVDINGNAPSAQVPFIVTTVARTINGRYSPPGMYVQNAFMENGSIDNAKIGLLAVETGNINNLAVNTLQIAGNAVTVPDSISASDTLIGVNAWVTILSKTIYMADPGRIFASAVTRIGLGYGSQLLYIELWIGGTKVSDLGGNAETYGVSLAGSHLVGAGNVTVELRWWGGDYRVQVGNRNLFIQGVKR
jgi:hypothetical protein